ncbi:DUF4232 domain-containing protein [Nakamurella lactea]|uniref:DUF4232 domain-containing protein n=1 Tax=Nakamurella lactea TaxID=459515 RepID=UPI00048F66CE|nr:DUF4232 domain-containing protein [Nakamurella lactea]
MAGPGVNSRATRLACLVGLVLGVLSGCGIGAQAGQRAAETTGYAVETIVMSQTSGIADGSDGTDGQTSSRSVRSTPPMPTGSFPDVADPQGGTACQPSQLTLVAGGTDHAMMYRQFTVTATNTGGADCVLKGFASVQFRGTDGSTFWVAESHDLMPEPVPKNPLPVTLAPGASAVVRIGWSGTGAVHGLEQARDVIMTVTRGSAPAPVQLDPMTLPIDIVDGGTVLIGEWSPSD